jgi:lipoyl(octanoyl) transferase
MAADALLLQPGIVPYGEAFAIQRALATAVIERRIPGAVMLLEHPPVVTTGRRTDESEIHLPDSAGVEVVATNRGGRSTFHAPGQLVCYPILDLGNHGRDLKRYVRDLEEAIIRTVASHGLEGVRIDGLTGVWMPATDTAAPRKLASIGVHATRWVTTHGYALNVDLDPRPFTDWITACGLEDTAFTTMALELGQRVSVEQVQPSAVAAVADVLGLALTEQTVEEALNLAGARLTSVG